jgi:3-hydroxyacyl-CoA dehydrogenase
VEQLDAKRALLERVDAARRKGSVVSSNTSGIPVGVLAEGRSDDFRRHWLGTHFFNPPRYLRLLELIPTPDTDPVVLAGVAAFADLHPAGSSWRDSPTSSATYRALRRRHQRWWLRGVIVERSV